MNQETSAAQESPDLSVGTVTFLFSDIEGSTSLVQRLGEDYTDLLDRHNRILRASFSAGGGQEIGTEGDSFFVVFADAVAAVRAAIAAQTALAGEPWPEPVRVRMGLHTGAGRLGGDNYVGVDVNRAARVAGAAHGGQILLSEATRLLIQDHLPDGITLRSLGRYRLKGLDRTESLHQVEVDGLETGFPPPRAEPEHRLPTAMTPLVGRETDLDAVLSMLRGGDRLITITGPGGTGKTRLVTELLPLVTDRFAEDVRYLDLSGLTDWHLVLPAVARSLGVMDAEGRDLASAVPALVGDAEVLVVLDNMEQVLDAGPDVAGLVASTPRLKALITSREPLRVRGEIEYPLNPLPVPEADAPVEELLEVPSVELFVQRARAVAPAFGLSDANAVAVAEVVRHLDGLPLAIELAAPKLRVLTPEALLERLTGKLDLLRGGSRDMPERHRALTTAIAWSYDLLDEDTRRLFRRLGVFAGGFTLDAAEAVCTGGGTTSDGLLDAIGDLVSKSMVTFYLDDNNRPRYRLLETLRAFALQQLAEADEEEAIRSAHLRWCLDFTEQCEAIYTSDRFPEALDSIETERHNIRAALEWSLTSPGLLEEGLRIAGMLWIFWDVRGFVTEGLGWLSRLLDAAGAEERTPGRAWALDARGWLERLTLGAEAPDDASSEADAIWAELGDDRMLAWSLGMHGMLTYNAFDLERALAQFEESTRIARRVGDEPLAEIWCTYGLAHVHWAMGSLDLAEKLLTRSLDYSRKWRHVWATAHGQFSNAMLSFLKGDLSTASSHMSESLQLRVQMRDARGISDCLGALAILVGAQGDHRTAAALLGAAHAQHEAAGQRPVPWLQSFFEQIREASVAALGESDFEAAWATGSGFSREDAVAVALAASAQEAGTSV